jgi:hypothetical protein
MYCNSQTWTNKHIANKYAHPNTNKEKLLYFSEQQKHESRPYY